MIPLRRKHHAGVQAFNPRTVTSAYLDPEAQTTEHPPTRRSNAEVATVLLPLADVHIARADARPAMRAASGLRDDTSDRVAIRDVVDIGGPRDRFRSPAGQSCVIAMATKGRSAFLGAAIARPRGCRTKPAGAGLVVARSQRGQPRGRGGMRNRDISGVSHPTSREKPSAADHRGHRLCPAHKVPGLCDSLPRMRSRSAGRRAIRRR